VLDRIDGFHEFEMLEVVRQLLSLHVITKQTASVSLAPVTAKLTVAFDVSFQSSLKILNNCHFANLNVQHILKSALLQLGSNDVCIAFYVIFKDWSTFAEVFV